MHDQLLNALAKYSHAEKANEIMSTQHTQGWTENADEIYRLRSLNAELLAALQAMDRALIPMDYSDYRHGDELANAIIAARAAIATAQS